MGFPSASALGTTCRSLSPEVPVGHVSALLPAEGTAAHSVLSGEELAGVLCSARSKLSLGVRKPLPR